MSEDESGSRPGGIEQKSMASLRVLKLGCLTMLIFVCVGTGLLAALLQAGHGQLSLPGNSVLRAGSDDFVLSDFSFKDGNTYFLDLNGSGVRSIIQFQVVKGSHQLEIVFHHATQGDESDNKLLTIQTP